MERQKLGFRLCRRLLRLGRGSVRAEDEAATPARTEPRPTRRSRLPELQRLNGIADNGSAALQTELLMSVQPQRDRA